MLNEERERNIESALTWGRRGDNESMHALGRRGKKSIHNLPSPMWKPAFCKRDSKAKVLTKQSQREEKIWLNGRNSKKMYVSSIDPDKTCANVAIDWLHFYPITQFSDANPRRFFIYPSGFALSVNDSDEYKLRQELLRNMDVMVRPVTSNSGVVNVSFSLTVWALVDLVCLCSNIWQVDNTSSLWSTTYCVGRSLLPLTVRLLVCLSFGIVTRCSGRD